MINGLEHLPYEDKLRGLFSLEKQVSRKIIWPYGTLYEIWKGLFRSSYGDRTGRNGFKLNENRCRLGMRKGS